MAKMTKAQREWRPGQKKKPRSARALFASTVLSLEALLAIFIALAVFGLKRDSIPPALVLSVGAALAVLCLLTCGLLRKPLGYQIGWGIQIVFILTGFLMPSMFILGAAFTATWWYAVTKGRTMDLETARRVKEQEAWEAANPEVEES